jgi:hypothetical protein
MVDCFEDGSGPLISVFDVPYEMHYWEHAQCFLGSETSAQYVQYDHRSGDHYWESSVC